MYLNDPHNRPSFLSLAELLAMALWFAGSAVALQIAREWRLDAGTVRAALTQPQEGEHGQGR
jgi:hypothetical protein